MEHAGPSREATKILVGIDGSDGNRTAVNWALTEARARGAGLLAAYAWHIPTFAYSAPYFVPVSTAEMADEGRKMLESVLEEAGADPGAADLRVVEGTAAAALRDLSGEPDVDLVVVGSRGRRTAADLFLGSTSHALSHRCPKPLAIVPTSEAGSATRPRVGHIVVGTDGSEGGDNAVSWAAEEARRSDSVLEVVLAWTWTSPFVPLDGDTSVPIDEIVEKAAEETLARAIDRLERPGLTVKWTIREGAAADVLLEQSRQADMLVVGRRGLGMARELFLGSVSHACSHRSAVPVVVVPGHRA